MKTYTQQFEEDSPQQVNELEMLEVYLTMLSVAIFRRRSKNYGRESKEKRKKQQIKYLRK